MNWNLDTCKTCRMCGLMMTDVLGNLSCGAAPCNLFKYRFEGGRWRVSKFVCGAFFAAPAHANHTQCGTSHHHRGDWCWWWCWAGGEHVDDDERGGGGGGDSYELQPMVMALASVVSRCRKRVNWMARWIPSAHPSLCPFHLELDDQINMNDKDRDLGIQHQ